jgi:predicted alpha/beta hydrolase family esterase
MTVQVLFVQGAGPDVHDGWDRKLVDSLERELGPDYRVRYPRMPEEHDPRYAAWKPALLRELDSLGDGAILIGHSVGGTMLLHVLAERAPSVQPRALMLIAAPFIGDGGWPSDEIQPRTDFALPAGLSVFLYHGSDDKTVPTAHVRLYAGAIPQATVRMLAGRDHQLNNDLGDVARDIRSLTAGTA